MVYRCCEGAAEMELKDCTLICSRDYQEISCTICNIDLVILNIDPDVQCTKNSPALAYATRGGIEPVPSSQFHRSRFMTRTMKRYWSNGTAFKSSNVGFTC